MSPVVAVPFDGGLLEAHTFNAALKSCWQGRWASAKDGQRSFERAEAMGHACLAGTFFQVSDLTYARVKQVADNMIAAGESPATVNRRLSALSAVLDEAYKLWGIPKIPLPFVKEGSGRKETLTQADVKRIVSELDQKLPDYGLFVKFLVSSGMRLSEAANIRREDLMPDEAQGTIVHLRDTKNGKDRFVPVPAFQFDYLMDRCSLNKDNLLFDFDVRGFQRAFKAVADRLFPGRGIVPHTLRHTCASWMVAADVPLHIVSDFLGHRSLTTTRRYAHNATNALRNAALKVFS